MLKKEKNPLLPAVRWLGNVFSTASSMVFWHYITSVLYVYSSISELSQTNQTTLQNKIICDICSLWLCLRFNYNNFNTAKPKFLIMLSSVISQVSYGFASGKGDD